MQPMPVGDTREKCAAMTAPSRFELLKLPDEILEKVVLHLSPDTLALARLAAASRNLRQVVRDYSSLWPRILSTLVASVQLRNNGLVAHIDLPPFPKTFLSPPIQQRQLLLSPSECHEASTSIRNMIPPECFNALVTPMLQSRSYLSASTDNADQQEGFAVLPFVRLSREYRPHLYHRDGVLSIAEDMPDFIFDVSNEDLIALRDRQSFSDTDGVCVRELMYFLLLRNEHPDHNSFEELESSTRIRQLHLGDCSRKFKKAASSRGLCMPNRRHVSERYFINQTWPLDYALDILQQCQDKIQEELREQNIQALLEAATTNICMSPYSYLTAQFIGGDLGKKKDVSDQEALRYTLASLEELDFAYRNTPYNELKYQLLGAGDKHWQEQRGCLDCDVLRHLPAWYSTTFHIWSGLLQLSPSFPSDEDSPHHMPDVGDSPDAERAVTGEEDLDRSWCIIEKAYEVRTRKTTQVAYEIDDSVDFGQPAFDLRDWLFYLYACCFYSEAGFTSEHEARLAILEDVSIPPVVSVRLIDMVIKLATLHRPQCTDIERWQEPTSRGDFILKFLGVPQFSESVRGLRLSHASISCHSRGGSKQVNDNYFGPEI